MARNPRISNRKSKPKSQKSLDTPLRFEPFLRPMVWGGRRLVELGKALPTKEAYGESWEISDHPLHRSVSAVGPWAGQSIRHLMEQERRALLGNTAGEYETFPWLIKFLDACDWLSVQVHPDTDSVAQLWPGEGSKTEAWLVMAAEPGSRIYAGLVPGTDEATLRDALESGTVAKCLHHFEPRAGDCIFLPAGTVHAVGGGVLLAEVQQTSDATFRLFDWNRHDAQGRTRTLHIEEALACIDWTGGPVGPIHTTAVTGAPVGGGLRGCVHQVLVDCPFFHLEFLRENAPFECDGQGHMQVWLILAGTGSWDLPDRQEEARRGQVWLLPAAVPRTWFRPEPELDFLRVSMASPAA